MDPLAADHPAVAEDPDVAPAGHDVIWRGVAENVVQAEETGLDRHDDDVVDGDAVTGDGQVGRAVLAAVPGLARPAPAGRRETGPSKRDRVDDLAAGRLRGVSEHGRRRLQPLAARLTGLQQDRRR